MIQITENLSINETEIQEDFVRSSGPGGQNVNKVATAVQLRFNVKNSASLPDDVRERLIKLAGNRVTEAGELIISARRYRNQARNREDARSRLIELIRKATIAPKPRRKRRASATSKLHRMMEKRKKSEIKKRRRFDPSSDI
ncbi:MAG: aminoacyl-tRNA hydrolase [bacterium]|jgi:ribosome-associated protein|nr:aminoacyl-tRNA hydrolase [bacterium]